MIRFVLLFTALSNLSILTCGDGLIEVFKWKQMDFVQNPVASSANGKNPASVYFPGNFIQYNNVPMGATHYRGRLFITMPRRGEGVQSTLNYIDLRTVGSEQSPKLRAYPSFEMNQFDGQRSDRFTRDPSINSKGFVSVYRTSTDSCGRLWFVDTGILEYPNNRIDIQRPSIWVMDLETDRVLHRFEFPPNIAMGDGRGCASITIDTDKGCHNTFAYIPDFINSTLYVYSLQQNRIWPFQHTTFNLDPTTVPFNISGLSFTWPDGIFSTSMGPRESDGSRKVFYHPRASLNEFYVKNNFLQNEANSQSPVDGPDFRLLGSRGAQRQSTLHEFDPITGVLFYGELQRYGVGCWNSRKPFDPANHGTVAIDQKRIIYPSDLTIDDEGTMWMMTNSLPIAILSKLDRNVFNFRIWKQSTTQAIVNTVCENQKQPHHHHHHYHPGY